MPGFFFMTSVPDMQDQRFYGLFEPSSGSALNIRMMQRLQIFEAPHVGHSHRAAFRVELGDNCNR